MRRVYLVWHFVTTPIGIHVFFGLNVYLAANIALATLINQLRLVLSLSLVFHILIRHRITIRIPKLNVEQGLLAFCLLLTMRFL